MHITCNIHIYCTYHRCTRHRHFCAISGYEEMQSHCPILGMTHVADPKPGMMPSSSAPFKPRSKWRPIISMGYFPILKSYYQWVIMLKKHIISPDDQWVIPQDYNSLLLPWRSRRLSEVSASPFSQGAYRFEGEIQPFSKRFRKNGSEGS